MRRLRVSELRGLGLKGFGGCRVEGLKVSLEFGVSGLRCSLGLVIRARRDAGRQESLWCSGFNPLLQTLTSRPAPDN